MSTSRSIVKAPHWLALLHDFSHLCAITIKYFRIGCLRVSFVSVCVCAGLSWKTREILTDQGGYGTILLPNCTPEMQITGGSFHFSQKCLHTYFKMTTLINAGAGKHHLKALLKSCLSWTSSIPTLHDLTTKGLVSGQQKHA